ASSWSVAHTRRHTSPALAGRLSVGRPLWQAPSLALWVGPWSLYLFGRVVYQEATRPNGWGGTDLHRPPFERFRPWSAGSSGWGRATPPGRGRWWAWRAGRVPPLAL